LAPLAIIKAMNANANRIIRPSPKSKSDGSSAVKPISQPQWGNATTRALHELDGEPRVSDNRS